MTEPVVAGRREDDEFGDFLEDVRRELAEVVETGGRLPHLDGAAADVIDPWFFDPARIVFSYVDVEGRRIDRR